MMIVDVLRCIEQHPEQPGWEQQQWAAALSAVTGWRSLIADQAHWPALERATPPAVIMARWRMSWSRWPARAWRGAG